MPEGRCPVGVYETATAPYRRAAIFPHGSHKAGIGVVSDRAIKHIHELTFYHGTKDSLGREIHSAVLFIVNRADCEYFRPAHEADMLFAQVLKRAQSRGVTLIVKEVCWEEEIAYLGRTLPVHFDPCVKDEEIDETHLKAVSVVMFR